MLLILFFFLYIFSNTILSNYYYSNTKLIITCYSFNKYTRKKINTSFLQILFYTKSDQIQMFLLLIKKQTIWLKKKKILKLLNSSSIFYSKENHPILQIIRLISDITHVMSSFSSVFRNEFKRII